MRKLLTPQQKHQNHHAIVRPGRGPHAGQLFCVKCQKHIQWLSQRDYEFLLANP